MIKKVIDPVIRMNELRQGRINLVLETSPLDRPQVEKMANVDINSYLPYAFYQVAINTKAPSSPNADARVALSMALDRAGLVPSITDSKEGVVLNSGPFPADIFSSNIPEYVDKPVPDLAPRDLEKARRLAASGGIAGRTAILLYPDSLGDFGARMAQGIASQLAAHRREGRGRDGPATRCSSAWCSPRSRYELALVYCDGFDNLYSSLGQWYRSDGELNISGIGDSSLDVLFDEWDKAVVMADWVDLTLRLNRRIAELAPAVYLCTLQKDVYSRGIRDVTIATDNPFLSVEDWSLEGWGDAFPALSRRASSCSTAWSSPWQGPSSWPVCTCFHRGTAAKASPETGRSFLLLLSGSEDFSTAHPGFSAGQNHRKRRGHHPPAGPGLPHHPDPRGPRRRRLCPPTARSPLQKTRSAPGREPCGGLAGVLVFGAGGSASVRRLLGAGQRVRQPGPLSAHRPGHRRPRGPRRGTPRAFSWPT